MIGMWLMNRLLKILRGVLSHGGTPKSSKSWMTTVVLKPMVLVIPHFQEHPYDDFRKPPIFISCFAFHCLALRNKTTYFAKQIRTSPYFSCITQSRFGYESIPIDTIVSGMNIHLPAILMFTRGTRFWPIPILSMILSWVIKSLAQPPISW